MIARASIKTATYASSAVTSHPAARVSRDRPDTLRPGWRRSAPGMNLRPQGLDKPDQLRAVGHFLGELVIDRRRRGDERLLVDLVHLQVWVVFPHLGRQRVVQPLPF